MPQINLTALDARLLADIDQQLRDGLITQAEADELKRRIKGSGK